MKMPRIYLVLLILPAVIGYRPEDHHHHHVRHHHKDDSARHGSLDDILRRLDGGHHPKKVEVLSIDEASKQLQKAMDDYSNAVKHRAWDDDVKVDDWSFDNEPSLEDKSGDDKTGVDSGFDTYDSNGVELDDEDDNESQFAADAPHSVHSSHSRTKWETLGTHEALRATIGDPGRTAKAKGTGVHATLVRNSWKMLKSCSAPIPVIVRVSKVYPALVNKKFVEDCVQLHLCNQITGCCSDHNHSCQPSKVSVVTLPLKAQTQIWEKHKYSDPYHIEYVHFTNHTSCMCQEIKNRTALDTINFTHEFAAPPRRRTPVVDGTSASLSAGPSSSPNHAAPAAPAAPTSLSVSNQRQARNIVQQDSGFYSRILGAPAEKMSKKNDTCRCPTRYTARLLPSGDCICDCFDKQSDCLRNKRGKDYFIKPDQECIRSGQCKVPSCDYGEYMKYVGKCPGRIENFHESKNRSKKPSDFYFLRSWRPYGS